jgi:hypothetical protein
MWRTLAIVVFLVVVAGCGGGTSQDAAQDAVAPAPVAAPPASTAGATQQLLSTDGAVLYTVAYDGTATTVAAADTTTGVEVGTATLKGRYALPVLALDGTLGGLSRDGSTLVLQTSEGADDVSRFALVDTSFAEQPELLELPGELTFDALSPDAQRLFLVEHLPPADSNRYFVRLYDRATGELAEQPIVDKRLAASDQEIVMAGYPLARMESPAGEWVYTLYKGEGELFVHALATDGWAVCIDLPPDAGEGAERDGWTMGLLDRGPNLVARNAGLGLAVEIDVENFGAALIES